MAERALNYVDESGDRELEALISKHVFDECLHDPDFSTDVTPIEHRDRGAHRQCRRCGEILEETAFMEDIFSVWQPSVNLNQAFQAWTVFAETRGLRLMLEQLATGEWRASCEDRQALGGTPAVAVCRVILAGLGITQGPDVA